MLVDGEVWGWVFVIFKRHRRPALDDADTVGKSENKLFYPHHYIFAGNKNVDICIDCVHRLLDTQGVTELFSWAYPLVWTGSGDYCSEDFDMHRLTISLRMFSYVNSIVNALIYYATSQ